jgi:sugar lactone lactonase YvrE
VISAITSSCPSKNPENPKYRFNASCGVIKSGFVKGPGMAGQMNNSKTQQVNPINPHPKAPKKGQAFYYLPQSPNNRTGLLLLATHLQPHRPTIAPNPPTLFSSPHPTATYAPTMLEITPIASTRSRWGEGPVWWKNSLYYVDIEGHRVHRFTPSDNSESSWEIGQRVGTVVPRESGGLLIAGDHGIAFLDEETGTLTPIADPEPDKPDNRFNDGKCSPDGRFFAGTISLIKKTGDAKLYRLDPDLTLHEAFGPVTNSNGIVWSPDGLTVYYIDTPRAEVLAFDYDNGHLRNLRTAFSTAAIPASPDGMAIDENGNLWIAFCHGACVVCFDPMTGEILRRIDLPCLETTACAFGGPALEDLYVTTGIHKTEVEEHAGRLFIIRGLGVKGLPAHAFAG